MLIDTHAHLHDEMFAEDQAEVIERAFSQGITDIIDIGDDMASSAQAIALAKEYKRIYAAVGIHPQTAATMLENDEEDDLVSSDTLDILVRLVPDRVRTILPGLIILHTIIKLYKSRSIQISTAGVREGYLYSKLVDEAQK